jgi:hypothetical protein
MEEQARIERDHMEEQARIDRDERKRQDDKTKRLEAISQTIKWWNDLYDLSAEIRYFTKPKADGPTIEDSLKGIFRIVNTREDVINKLHFTFPTLSLDDVDLFREFFRIGVLSSDTGARCIRRKNMASQEIEVLQDCLEVILEGVKNIAHHELVIVLRSLSRYMEIKAREDDESVPISVGGSMTTPV